MSDKTTGPVIVFPFYGLGVIGSWFWFWQQADEFWEYVWAIVQGIVWPAYMVYQVFQSLAS